MYKRQEPQIISQGARILKLVALVQPAQSSQFILAGALRGAGDTRATAVITFLTVLLVRPSLALLAINKPVSYTHLDVYKRQASPRGAA